MRRWWFSHAPLHHTQKNCNMRSLFSVFFFSYQLLYLEWARPAKWMKKQPLCLVRKYFGDKIALYFCWLGFYTKMLYAPAIVGTLCFFYGLLSMDSDDNIPSKEICDRNGPGNITLCPLCDKACKYQTLADSCKFARLTYLFDNPATVFFAIFMSLWGNRCNLYQNFAISLTTFFLIATVFLELWRRKQSVIQWEWDLQGMEQDEEPRPGKSPFKKLSLTHYCFILYRI